MLTIFFMFVSHNVVLDRHSNIVAYSCWLVYWFQFSCGSVHRMFASYAGDWGFDIGWNIPRSLMHIITVPLPNKPRRCCSGGERSPCKRKVGCLNHIRDRPKLLKRVVITPLPNVQHKVWVSRVLWDDHYKWTPRVTVGVVR